MKKLVGILSLIAPLVLVPGPSPAQDRHPLEPIRALWRAGDYQGAAPLLVDYRKLAYGRTAEVDYMIGTCACQLSGQADFGRRWLGKVLQDYRLTLDQARVVRDVLDQCGTAIRPVDASPQGAGPVAWQVALGQSSVEGKTFYWAGQTNALSSSPATTIRKIPYAEISGRRFPLSQTSSAIREVSRVAGPGAVVRSQGPFVVASLAGHKPEDLVTTGRVLEQFLAFFRAEYDMDPPEQIITVYLVRDPSELRRFAERVHGIRISGSTIAYNYADERSLAAALPALSPTEIGSLAHELFHLMAHERFGDIPAWLDEGLAALYEVSVLTSPSGIAGVDNWRRRALQEVWDVRPPIGRLVRMTSTEFENQPNDYELRRQAANHATARYLMLYLQEQGKLGALYRAFRDRSPATAVGPLADDAVRTLESVVGPSVGQLDQDFERWFKSGPRPTPPGIAVEKWLPPR